MGAVRNAARRDPILLRPEAHRVQDTGLRRVSEIDCFTIRAQGEVEVRLHEVHETPGRNQRAGRNHEPVRGRIIGQHGAAEIERLVAVVVQLDEIQFGIVGVSENLVDDDRIERIGAARFARPGRTADQIAGAPRGRIAFTERRPDHDE